uniref:Uncharacterized protein n=1 Tax=Rhipicephalus zambeziensis TaxID=60191 RepID=A0A224YGC2_9ACAR
MNWRALGGCVYSTDFVFAAIAAWPRKCVVVIVYPPSGACTRRLFLLVTVCAASPCIVELSKVSATFTFCRPCFCLSPPFFYPLPVSVFMSKGHTMSPPPPFYVFLFACFPSPFFFLLWPS